MEDKEGIILGIVGIIAIAIVFFSLVTMIKKSFHVVEPKEPKSTTSIMKSNDKKIQNIKSDHKKLLRDQQRLLKQQQRRNKIINMNN